MMELTQKTEYAVRSMLYLSRNRTGQAILVGEIADSMKIPKTFLAKILQDLVKSGLVKSSRGNGGGFMMAKPAELITLCEIVEAMEGPIRPNQCLMGENVCSFQKTCPVHPVWRRLQSVTRGILEEVTLKTLASGSTVS